MADTDTPPKPPRGFARMDKSKLREISSRGGKEAHARGRAPCFTSEEGREAGRLGGLALSEDRDYMREIGKRGGLAASKKPRRPRAPLPLPPETKGE